MSNSTSSLLTRNLHDIFGENDPVRRRAAIDEIFTEDCVFYEPKGVYRGRGGERPLKGGVPYLWHLCENRCMKEQAIRTTVDIPASLYRKLKEQAAAQGRSIRELILLGVRVT